MVARRLPPYPELKQLVLPEAHGGEGMTYREVAIRYGLKDRATVGTTLRRRAEVLGEWPLPLDPRGKQRRVMDETPRRLPSYAVLKSMVLDQGAGFATIGLIYGVSYTTVEKTLRKEAAERGEWPLPMDRTERRRKGRKHALARDPRYVKAVGIWWVLEDYLDEHDMSMSEFARQKGFTVSAISKLKAKGNRSVDEGFVLRSFARQVLNACGEEQWTVRRSRADAAQRGVAA